MDGTQLAITKVMIVGVIISLALVIIGGIVDLYQYGNTIVDYTTFHVVSGSFMVFNSPGGVIKLGIFALVMTQVARVAVAGWFFITLRDYFFAGITVFIVVVIVVSLVWGLSI